MHASREANLVGVLGLLVAGRVSEATDEAAGLGATAPAAIVSLPHYEGCSIDHLRAVLGLSHPGTVRLVDRLEAAGLVRRSAPGAAGADRRRVALHTTERGRAAAVRILAAREAAVRSLLAGLGEDERAQLGELAARVIDGVVDGRAAARRVCRLCDADACGHPDRCPSTLAADRAEARA